MKLFRFVSPIAALALSACGSVNPSSPDSGPVITDASTPDAGEPQGFFKRHPKNPVINPRDIISPTSDTDNMVMIADPCVLWDESMGLWRAYWTFWDSYAEDNGLAPHAGIYGATSSDGINFEPLEELALPPLGSFDSGSTETCDVIKIPDGPGESTPNGGVYYMYFSGSVDSSNEGQHKMALATSLDGERFTPISAELSPKNEEGLLFIADDVLGGGDVDGNFITDPTVILTDEGFALWSLCVRQIPEPLGGICFSTSNDGINWEHRGIVNGLERGFPIQPTVFYNPEEDRLDMYVVMDLPEEESEIHDINANLGLRVVGYFHATSADGMNWVEQSSERIIEEDLGYVWENSGMATGADAEVKDGRVHLYYPSFTTEGGSVFASLLNWPLNLATGDL